MSDDTQSVLDQMASGIMSAKKDKAAKLTPVGVEAQAPAPLGGKHETAFPYDDPQTILTALDTARRAIHQIREELAHVEGGILALEQLYGGDLEKAPTGKALKEAEAFAKREEERAADERVKFAEDFNKMQQEAQQAAYEQTLVEPVVAPAAPAPTDGWQCPNHGAEALRRTTSRKGREYSTCLKCEEFEK